MKLYFYGYNNGSAGLKAIAQSLGAKRIKHEGSVFKPRPTRAVVNWGSSSALPFNTAQLGKLFNKPEAISRMANKLSAFQYLSEYCRMPAWTTSKEEAHTLRTNHGAVMARKILTGHSGDGIVYCGEEEDIPNAPLYTAYVKKKHEYRVHMFKDTPSIFVQRKARNTAIADPNWKIRNLAGGFAYASDPTNVGSIPPDVLTQARAAFERSGLDFGAVDVIYNDHEQKAYVLEINTAPGIMGRTLEFYTNTFKEVAN